MTEAAEPPADLAPALDICGSRPAARRCAAVLATLARRNAEAWMPMLFRCWEGPVRVSGSATGIDNLEVTGHD